MSVDIELTKFAKDFSVIMFRIIGQGSVVSIATGYGLDGPGIESRWVARFSAPVQTGPGAHPASCTVGTGSFPGVKSGRGVTLTPHPLLILWSWKSRAIPLLPLWAVRPVQSLSACTRVTFTFTFTYVQDQAVPEGPSLLELFDSEDEGIRDFRNIGTYLPSQKSWMFTSTNLGTPDFTNFTNIWNFSFLFRVRVNYFWILFNNIIYLGRS